MYKIYIYMVGGGGVAPALPNLQSLAKLSTTYPQVSRT